MKKTYQNNKPKKEVIDIVVEKIIETIENGKKPWLTFGKDDVFLGSNLLSYMKDGKTYSGINQWLVQSIALNNDDLDEIVLDKFKNRALADAMIKKTVSYTNLIEDFKIDPDLIKGVSKKAMIYKGGSKKIWLNEDGNLFVKQEGGKKRYQPTEEEIKQLGLRLVESKAKTFQYQLMYSAAQFIDHIPNDIIDRISDKISQIEPPRITTISSYEEVEKLAKNLGTEIKISASSSEGQFSAPYNNVILQPISSFSDPKDWVERAIIHIIEPVVQKYNDNIQLSIENQDSDENPIFTKKDGTPVLISSGIRTLIAEVVKDKIYIENNIESNDLTSFSKNTACEMSNLLKENAFNVFKLDKIANKIHEQVKESIEFTINKLIDFERISEKIHSDNKKLDQNDVRLQEDFDSIKIEF